MSQLNGVTESERSKSDFETKNFGLDLILFLDQSFILPQN